MAALQVDPNSPVPLEKQLIGGIQAAIASGRLAVGDTLPPVRQLAADLGIHFNTVARAYRELEREGLVRAVRGRGTVVTADQSTRRYPKREVLKALRSDLRQALARAKLAGIDRASALNAFDQEMATLWQENDS